MQSKGQELFWFSESVQYQPTKALLESIEKKLNDDKEISKDKKQNYTRVIREMNYTMGKLLPRWPAEIEKIVDNLRSILQEFQTTLVAVGKGSSFFCGSSGNPKQLENIYVRLVGYERIFEIVRPFQDKQIRDDIIARHQEQRSKNDASRKSSKRDFSVAEPLIVEKKAPETTAVDQCKNCQLMLAVSLCPNGYIAKKLVKQLPDTEWIAGILYEEGTVVDKDLDKAIEYYKAAYKKKNYQALYRLGSLNERGLYGKPYEYLKMWEEASANGHLEAMTDMGYLYENGLDDQETGRTILEPNFDKAFSYYSKAAEKNFPRALNNLATFYFSNDKYKDQAKCLKYLDMAAEAEYVKALHNLGLIYYEGKLVKPNEQKAKVLIRRAAEKGDIEGRIMYIEMMLNDASSCTVDKLTDLNRFCRQIIAKDEENAEAYYFLGIMCEEGYGCRKQPKTAFLYYTIAASMENDSANMKLGQCYKTGFGTEQDLREAIRCFQQAVRTNKVALISLGEIYQKGGHDLNPNYQKAFEYYYEACNFGIPEAYIHLGNMYKNGRHVKRNDAKAEQYFQKAQSFESRNGAKLTSSITIEGVDLSFICKHLFAVFQIVYDQNTMPQRYSVFHLFHSSRRMFFAMPNTLRSQPFNYQVWLGNDYYPCQNQQLSKQRYFVPDLDSEICLDGFFSQKNQKECGLTLTKMASWRDREKCDELPTMNVLVGEQRTQLYFIEWVQCNFQALKGESIYAITFERVTADRGAELLITQYNDLVTYCVS